MQTNSAFPSVCVIGAGAAGLAAAKELKAAGIAFECYDLRERPGGIWAYTEQPGITSAWRTLNINSPRGTYEFSDFPMPADYPDYPQHSQVYDYFERAIDHFGLRPHLRLGCGVARVAPSANQMWDVTLSDGQTRRYAAVVVANGHHNEPNIPALPGTFAGGTLHARDYRYREPYARKRVVVVGFGNSGSQIAVDVSFAAEQTFLAIRRGGWLLPHYIWGWPIHKVMTAELSYLLNRVAPWPLSGWLLTATYRLLLGYPERFGLPRPDHHFTSALVTISENLLNRIGDGRVRIKPHIVRLDGNSVVFADGSRETVDEIIYCTGYQTVFPFLDEAIFAAPENRVRLYKQIFLPGWPSLVFVGAFQANAWGLLPLFEAQGRLVAAYLSGQYALPEQAAMERSNAQDAASVARRFVRSPRNHYMLIGPIYAQACRAELARGRRRVMQGAARSA
jgi:dimethylaniline monooxygenase (N-oxide forming)